ncbi:MAG: hypothetical protein COB36_09655 [Alphaproteobacteria bacterium]|nr:MAG: hypothetical protein COB36_09655 [Alphaproteobacteria bacterium]
MRSDLRNLIREVLAEELAGMRSDAAVPAAPQIREENVSILTDGDLAAFVRRILDLGNDHKSRAEIEAGRHIFRLGSKSMSRPSVTPHDSVASVCFNRGIISEKQIRRLSVGITVVKVTKNVRFTPLAQDELRKRGIKVEREKT